MHVKSIPSERIIGRLRVDVGVGPIARMFPAQDWQQPDNAGGGAVFDGRAGEVVENIDRESGSETGSTGRFNFDAHIHDSETGHPVPYLTVSATVTRDGTPVFTDLPLVPVARPHKGTAGLHYGNNISLDPTGTYHVLVRIAAGPLTGTDTEQRLDFDLDFATATA